MKTTQEPMMDSEMEDVLAVVSPLVKSSFTKLGGPRASVLDAIHQEAQKQTVKRNLRKRLLFSLKITAVAASFLALASTAIVLFPEETSHLFVHAHPKQATQQSLANFVMAYQGMDSDSYFN
jgi:hypothetical protein